MVAPTQRWFYFLVSLSHNLSELDAGKPSKHSQKKESATKTTQNGETTEKSAGEENNSNGASSSESGGVKVIFGSDGMPDLEMMEYEDMKKKWKREDPLLETDVEELTAANLRYFSGGAQPMKKPTYLANSLVVNRRKGKVFEKSALNCKFDNFVMKLPGVEPRGAARVQLLHPIVGILDIYTLHLDHVWEKNRRGQFDLLCAARGLSSPDAHPHILMGDFNAITKTDYTPEYEEEAIRLVRQNGNWEVPTYTLLQHLESLGYVDFWRKVNPTIFDEDVTTCAYHTRIDYIFVSSKLAEMIDWEHPNTYSHILSGVRHSDHFPVLANIQFKQPS